MLDYEILSDDELRKRMSELAREYDDLRRKALELNNELIPKLAKCQVGLTYLEPFVFTNAEVISKLQLAKSGKVKLHQPDKEALIQIELGERLLELKEVDLAIRQNDSAFEKYARLLSYSQSEMKLR